MAPPITVDQFDAAYARSEGLGRPRLQRMFRVPLLGAQLRNFWRVLHLPHRFLSMRALAQVGFKTFELMKSLGSCAGLAALWLLFFGRDTLPNIAAGSMGTAMAGYVCVLLFFFTVMTLLAVADFIAICLGTIAHARGHRILEDTNLATIDGMGPNIFTPNDAP